MGNDEMSAVFIFSKKTGFLKTILPNVDSHEELKALQHAVQLLMKPENGNWISRLFKQG